MMEVKTRSKYIFKLISENRYLRLNTSTSDPTFNITQFYLKYFPGSKTEIV